MSFLNFQRAKKEIPAPAKKLVPREAAFNKLPAAGTGAASAKKAGLSDVLRRPRITEKAAASAERGVYVFEVSPAANKRDIFRAVQELYKVTPAKVTVATIPAKRITVKGRTGLRKGGKKAHVYLKKGEKIELV